MASQISHIRPPPQIYVYICSSHVHIQQNNRHHITTAKSMKYIMAKPSFHFRRKVNRVSNQNKRYNQETNGYLRTFTQH